MFALDELSASFHFNRQDFVPKSNTRIFGNQIN